MKKILILYVVSTIFSLVAICQTDFYNNGLVQILNTSDTIYITGSLNNLSTASLRNTGGNIYVLNNLTNDEANMNSGGGNLWFTGSTLQTIAGSQPFRTNNWIVNNAGGVLLQNRIGIGNTAGGTLTFLKGYITSGTASQDVYFYPNSNFTGYGDDKHIIGYCTKSGSTNFTYPIGNGLLKADLDISGLVSATDFQCKYFGSGYGIYTPQSPLVSIFAKEYWILDRVAGSSSAQITLKWNDARQSLNHSSPADLRAGHFTGSNWINEGGSGSGNTLTGSVTSGTVNSFSPFTFASVSVALPLTILDYEVIAGNNCSVNISWKSEDERFVADYIIQKSTNNRDWENIDKITISTAVNGIVSHVYIDEQPGDQTPKYRIEIQNMDGTYFYTSIKMVHLNCNPVSIQVFPTIIKNNVYVNIPDNAGVKWLTITNSYGQALKKINNPGAGQIAINLSSLPAGTYIISVNKNNQMQNFKFIKAD